MNSRDDEGAKSLRVAVVSPWYPNPQHKTEGIFVQNEVEALRQAGVDVFVVHLFRELPAGQVRIDGVDGIDKPDRVGGINRINGIDGINKTYGRTGGRTGLGGADRPEEATEVDVELASRIDRLDEIGKTDKLNKADNNSAADRAGKQEASEAGKAGLDGGASTIRGVPVIRLGMNPANPLSVTRAATRLAKFLDDADVVHSHAISVLPVMWMALLARKTCKQKPWVHSEHWSALANPQTTSPLLQFVRPGFASLLKLPDVVLAESQRLASAVNKFRGSQTDANVCGASTYSKLTQIIPCIVATPEKLVERRKNLTDELWLTSTGGVIERKNPKLAVETVAELQKQGVTAHLRWSGVGEQMAECRQLAASLGVDCQFLGTQSPKQVQTELAQADFFIAPTKGDNFFVAAAEALVNGRPLLASNLGGHVEYADTKYSEIVSEQTPTAYAAGLLRLRDKTRGISAHEISGSVAKKFASETVASQLVDVYNTALTLKRQV